MANLIVILGDQLSPDIASLQGADPSKDHILMAEVRAENTYVPHHKKKMVFILSAMRHFAKRLEEKGFCVHYTSLSDPDNTHQLCTEVMRHFKRGNYDRVIVTEASEYRVLSDFKDLQIELPCLEILEDDRFICAKDEFKKWASGRKQLRMEYFYREMRKKTGLLMEGDNPAGGKWNYDSDNRKACSGDLFMPRPCCFEPDDINQDVIKLVEQEFPDNMGNLKDFWFAVTSDQAKEALDHFIEVALKDFGTYQDAMLNDNRFLYHSVLSHYINIGLLDPFDVCQKVAKAYEYCKVEINSAEGFIRQIIGWREYVRGIYHLKMPEYVNENFFAHDRKLPEFYWTAKTHMNCMKACITQTIEEAYAHHIQRLMVTGNFALLAGLDPNEVHLWYLAVYCDAFEWVELPNTLGMSQFGDGGVLASKPYAASGNYIHKMSDYCENCSYDVKKKTGQNSCPFNSLYWHFLIRHKEKLQNNPRISRSYHTWDRMKEDTKRAYEKTAEDYLSRLEAGEVI